MAVDGNLATFWETKKASGRNVLPKEWNNVDLGSSKLIGQVKLEWAGNYATQYTIQVSQDNNAWTTVYNTANGNGGNDTIAFGSISARYIQLNSSAWSSSSLRNWLKEFEIYASGGSLPTATPTPTSLPATPLPASTPLPTARATPLPTPTATSGSGSAIHAGDLDNVSSLSGRKYWNASVTILVHNAGHSPVSGATVNGVWSSGASGSASCTTGANGLCTLTKSNVSTNTASVTFTVNSVSGANLTYSAAANHDPDGDSNGTQLTLVKP